MFSSTLDEMATGLRALMAELDPDVVGASDAVLAHERFAAIEKMAAGC